MQTEILALGTSWWTILKMDELLPAAVFAFAGVLILVFSFVIIDKATPGNLWKEIIEEKNTAVAVLMGLMAVAIAIIIAASIHG
ncbi:MAG: DUF350 domain-containing protein [Planctomycetota bacterium]